jgi:hypothetical protein
VSAIEELRAACRDSYRRSESEKIADGEPMWLSGSPARSEEGTIALAIDDLTIVIRESDVQEVKRNGERFQVKVRAGTEMLFRLEGVAEARAAARPAESCNCERLESRRQVRGEGDGAGSHDGLEIVVEVCSLFPVCLTILGRDYCINIPYDCHIV